MSVGAGSHRRTGMNDPIPVSLANGHSIRGLVNGLVCVKHQHVD